MEKEIFEENGVEVDHVYYGKGCSVCHQQGYRGRIAMQEVLEVDDTIKSMLLNNKSIAEIRTYAKHQGMDFLIHDGLKKMKDGLTSMEEIMQVSIRV